MRYILLILFSLSSLSLLKAQELNCQVSVNSQQLSVSDKTAYQTLQKSIYEFMNDRQWSNVTMTFEERIECSIFITLTGKTGDIYTGKLQVQSRRPVFNSSYNSVMLNYIDNDLEFEYVQHDPLNFDVNSFEDNLTSILAFYAYIIIGMDFDSFSPNGGTPFYNQAQTIVNNAQNSGKSGWTAFDSQKNRYWLVENLLNSTYSGYRDFLYQYHRKGLDVMYEELAKGRTQALNAIELLQEVYRAKPGLMILQLLMDAKRDEFIGMFSEAPGMEKAKAKNVLVEIDPANSDKYVKMVQGG